MGYEYFLELWRTWVNRNLLLFNFVASGPENSRDVVSSYSVASFEFHEIVSVGTIDPSVVLFEDWSGSLSKGLHD
jgi:hypothetical protein